MKASDDTPKWISSMHITCLVAKKAHFHLGVGLAINDWTIPRERESRQRCHECWSEASSPIAWRAHSSIQTEVLPAQVA